MYFGICIIPDIVNRHIVKSSRCQKTSSKKTADDDHKSFIYVCTWQCDALCLICWVYYTWDMHVLALSWSDRFGANVGRVSAKTVYNKTCYFPF